MTRYFDISGQERDAAWLAENYGSVFVQGQSDKYLVAELREMKGKPILTVVVLGDATRIKCYFFGYELGMLAQYTRFEGTVVFPLPVSYTYKIAGQGSHWLWVDGLRLIGLGVPEGAPNWRHLDVVLEEKV